MKKRRTLFLVHEDSKNKFKCMAAEKGKTMLQYFDDITNKMDKKKRKGEDFEDFFKL